MNPSRLLYLVALLLAACTSSTIEGSGRLVEEQRTVSAFSAITLENGLAGRLSLGPTAVSLRLDDNLMSEVRSDVEGGVLRVASGDGAEIRPSVGAEVRVATPTVEAITVSSGASVVGEANGEALRLDASGDSRLTVRASSGSALVTAVGGSVVALSGAARVLRVDASGGASVDSEAASEEADVEASGGARVVVRASSHVKVRASGSSEVVVVGDPASRDLDVAGEATVLFR
jgi:hypothetical protein